MANITAAQQTEILKIVSGLFNAAPGATYLTTFAGFVSGGGTTQQLAQALAADSAFTTGIMGGKVTAAAQVAQLMTNFGLTYGATTAADVAAQTWLTAQVNAQRNFGDIVFEAVTYLNSAAAAADPVAGSIAQALSNKAAVSEYFSATLGLNATGTTTSAIISSLQAVVSTVTATTVVATAADMQAVLAQAGAVPSATYSLANAAAVDEGGTAIFNLTTANVLNGTMVSYTITGVQAGDVTATSGTAQVINNAATISVATVADLTTEGAQTMTVAITGTSATATGVINDTSLTPNYTLTAAAASSNEGASNTFTITSSNASDNSTISYDLSGTGIAAADVTGGLTGTVTLVAGTGTITVAAAADATTEGAESYTVTAKDSAGTTVATATASIADTSVTPVLGADSVAGTIVNGQGTAIMTAADITAFRNNDTTSAGAASTGTITVDMASATGGQLVTLANGNTMFVADTGTRQGSFTYSNSDISGLTGTVNVTLNSAPVITSAATLAATEDTAATGTVVVTDADADTLTYTFGAATNGTVTAGTAGAYTYTPNANYNGSDTFKVSINDGYTTVTQDIAVTVAAVNDDPQVLTPAPAAIAVVAGGTATADLSLYATDPDTGATLTYTADAATKNGGTVTLGADGKTATITYAEGGGAAALGADSFGMTVTDGVIVTPIAATVTLTVSNTAPTAGALALAAKTGVTQTIDLVAGTSTAAGVTSTFTTPVSDAESNTLTPAVTVGSVSAGGSAEVLNGQIVYTSTIGYTGTETIKYTVTDGFGGTSAEQTITFTVASNTGGTSAADTLYGSTAAENIDGLASNDTIVGGGGLDTITGGDGNDTVTFSDGAVQILGAAGLGDTLVVNADAVASAFDLSSTSNQMMDANSKNSLNQAVIIRTFENIDATKSSGNFVLDDTAGYQTATPDAFTGTDESGGDVTSTTSVKSGTGDDQLYFTRATGTGVVVQSSDGNDTITVDGVEGGVTAGAGTAAATGTFNIDGGAGNDTIDVRDTTVVHTIAGGAGDDSILLGTGSSVATGGDGNDSFTAHGTATKDNISGGAGNDTLNTTAALLLNTDTVAGGTGTDTLSTTEDDNDLTLTTTSPSKYANMTGIDKVIVDVANTLTVDNGFVAQSDANLVLVSADNDAAAGSTDLDLGAFVLSAAVGAAYNVQIYTEGLVTLANAENRVSINDNTAGDNDQVGGSVTDGTGNDSITGGAVNDAITLSAGGSDVVTGGAGNDTVTFSTTAANANVDLGAGNDTLNTTAALLTNADTVTGGTGTDTLSTTEDDNDLTLTTTSPSKYANMTGIDKVIVDVANTLTVDNGFVAQSDANLVLVSADNDAAAGSTDLDLGAFVLSAAVGAAYNVQIYTEGLVTLANAENRVSINDNTAGDNDQVGGTVTDGTGNDSITGGAVNDTITLSAGGNDVVTGGAGNDTVTFSTTAGNANVDLGAGNDTLNTTAALLTNADTVAGGTGTDTLSTTEDDNDLTLTTTSPSKYANMTGIDKVIVDVANTLTVDNGFVAQSDANLVLVSADNDAAAGSTDLDLGAFVLSAAVGAAYNVQIYTEGQVTLSNTVDNRVSISDNTAGDNDQVGGTVVSQNGNDTITGGAVNDAITGAAGNDVITGGAGNDTITAGGAGADNIDAGAGNDSMVFAANLGNTDTIAGGTGNDTLSFTMTGADQGVVNVTGVETVTVTGANSSTADFASTTGITTLNVITTGVGADAYTLSNIVSGTTVAIDDTGNTGTANALTINPVSGSALALKATTALADQMTTNATSVTLNSNGMTNTALYLTATALTSLTITGAGNIGFNASTATTALTSYTGTAATGTQDLSNLDFAAAGATISTGAANATIVGGSGADTITGGAGNDTITMNSASDVLTGGSNGTAATDGDTLVISLSSLSASTVDLSAADQLVAIGVTTNSAVQSGFEHVNASAYLLSGIQITGSSGGNAIVGSGAADLILGGAGNDTITGGAGADDLSGGAGADSFAFTTASTGTPTTSNYDTIQDYTKTAGTSFDTISATALIVGTQNASAGAGVATIGATGVATFQGGETTFAQHLTAVAAAIDATGVVAGEAAIWQEGADSYLYISDGVINGGVPGSTDVLIKLVGVTAGAMTFGGNAITAMA